MLAQESGMVGPAGHRKERSNGMEKKVVLRSRMPRGVVLAAALASAVVLSVVAATTVFAQSETTINGC